MKLPLKLRITLTGIATLLVWGHIVWDHFHGGIPSHHFLFAPDLPGIPNWVGGIAIPFFTWLLLYRIHKRIDRTPASTSSESLRLVALRFLLAALVAITISICFMNGIAFSDYIMGSLFILAFFFPLYKSEYILGWVLGSAFTFGAIIPMTIGSLIALVFFIFYTVPRNLIRYFQPKKG